ncbi:hypothetical protein TREES_T100009250 [Tupaia chinensis]|uniref:Uncharacterized protein n=1 Tax=Tupaia chinensis TaxID=246437 RepID=L9KG92_TUPCH|nr:hypothetical protein TREES_T100009250 [Tupaia chinensis]
MCYKSDISSSKSIVSTVEKELEKPLENGSELQEGDGLTVPTKLNLSEKKGEVKTSDRKPRTDIAAFENGAVQVPNPKNKMSYHRNNKNRNAENASYIHVQRDSIRTVSLNAPHRSRPTNGSYNKVEVNKEPKLNLCPGLCHHHLLKPSERISSVCRRAHDLKDVEDNSG